MTSVAEIRGGDEAARKLRREMYCAGGFQTPQGSPQGEITKGTFVKGHLCAYLYYKSWPVIFPTAIFHTENCRTKNL